MQSTGLTQIEIERLRRAALSYDGVGSTRDGRSVDGYTSAERVREIGAGRERFDQAAAALLRWDAQRRAGLGVRASTEQVVEGAVAVLRAGIGVAGIDAPVRVVYVIDEPNRKGFAYGTLPGHPESGEEAFVVELQADGAVTFTVSAFSRPASRLARLGGPVGHAVQSWMTKRYLRAL